MNELINHIVVVDEELDEVVELLGLFEGYDDSHAAPPEILRITLPLRVVPPSAT